jgi:anti-sigma regulatory factor (Ser/Thr protein kinase)
MSDPGRASPAVGQAVLLDQTFDADSLYALRSAAAAHAARAGLSGLRLYDVVGTVHELAANAVRHGAGHGRLLLWASDGVLNCQVSDDGAAGPAGDQAGWPVEHGHGLWLVRHFTPDISVSTGPDGTTVTASFPLEQDPPAGG